MITVLNFRHVGDVCLGCTSLVPPGLRCPEAARRGGADAVGKSRRAAAGRAQLLAKRAHSGRMQIPEKTAAIGGDPDGSGFQTKTE